MDKKKDKILFWVETVDLTFGIAKSLIEKYDCDPYALMAYSPKQKSFFDNQKLVKFTKSWNLRDYVNQKNHKSDIEKLKTLDQNNLPQYFMKIYTLNNWIKLRTDELFQKQLVSDNLKPF